MMQVDILTVFPQTFSCWLEQGIAARAVRNGLFQLTLWDLRTFCHDRHRTTDDYPYGGGAGMLMKAPPFFEAMDAVSSRRGQRPHSLLLTPQGRRLDQSTVRRLSGLSSLALICGHYEGIDERVARHLVDEEISIGDYVLMGGELPALVLLEAMIRLLPGVLGSAEAHQEESHYAGLLEYPQYTRPAEYRGHCVPPVLLSGDHKLIRRWRRAQAIKRTLQRRPEMLLQAELGPEDRQFIDNFRSRSAQTDADIDD